MTGVKKDFNLRLKLVVFITLLALITYSTSAVFIYYVQDKVRTWIDIPEVYFVLITFLLGIIWSGILAFFAAGFITKPLIRLEKAANHVANGDLNHELAVEKSKDEIGALSMSFNQMVTNLKGILTDIDNHATHTTSSVEKMKEAASNSKAQTRELEETIEQISKGAEESSNAIQGTVEAIEHATTIAKKVDEKANLSEEKAAVMVSELKATNEQIEDLLKGIGSLAENQDQSLINVTQLSDKAKEVEQVIGLVGDISEQTNLLALNASIEASRAGEEGRGFAVVAEEVRKLADQSSNAVKSISELIQAMQQDVEVVVASIKTRANETREESEKGKEVKSTIQLMSTSVLNVANGIKEISKLVEEQLHEIETTRSNSEQVSAIAEETSAGAEEITASMEGQAKLAESLEALAFSLGEEAQNLKRQMRQFKLS
ncbi:methyl-accepting chemotaxis protein [Saliterribacillus persicus]|uniref:Methyl-accepting chemotaxis protein n=1 Tax=Saliterribacillus persicus TaxID=930114 RepID=A0A368YGX9_9BACI|nr:methyl-accepting chemotaxis protein [Saliterribacillus persicus]RCW77444.1 methyl-accepting chemotaxis protein [Saliterribacillus persicus]